MTDRVVRAYSGGLDKSVAIGWIAAETGMEVVAVAADVGQGGEDLDVIRQRALDCGAVEAVGVDAKDEYADEYCLPALQAKRPYIGRHPPGARGRINFGRKIAIGTKRGAKGEMHITGLGERLGGVHIRAF